MTKRITLSLLAIFLGGLYTIAAGTSAFAHAALIGVDPEPGSTVDGAPKHVVFTFSETLKDPAFVAVSHEGKQRDGWTSTLEGARLIVTPPEGESIAGGEYVVSFRVVSADGHPIKGSTDFTVKGSAAEPSPSPSQSLSPDSNESAGGDESASSQNEVGGIRSLLTAPWAWGGFVMVLAIAVAAFVRSRSSARGNDSTQ